MAIDLLHVADKDENFVYRWFNCSPSQYGDHNMFMAQMEGWEPVEASATELQRQRIGQAVDSPAGGMARRGDLALYRMPKDQYEKTVAANTRKRAEQQATTIDTMVANAQANAAKALQDRGQKRIPGDLVFRSDVSDPQ